MNIQNFEFSRKCAHCGNELELDDYAIDTKTCYKRHVFFFKCKPCDKFVATGMDKIPEQQWHEFMSENMIKEIKSLTK